MNKKFELLREAVGCYKANHVSGDINEKPLLEFIDELEQLNIPVVVQQSELLIGLLTMLEKEGGNDFINKAEIVAMYQANL